MAFSSGYLERNCSYSADISSCIQIVNENAVVSRSLCYATLTSINVQADKTERRGFSKFYGGKKQHLPGEMAVQSTPNHTAEITVYTNTKILPSCRPKWSATFQNRKHKAHKISKLSNSTPHTSSYKNKTGRPSARRTQRHKFVSITFPEQCKQLMINVYL